jgi:succinoglycan biosynthesis transport protein ExoP
VYGLPVLGVIPKSRALSRSGSLEEGIRARPWSSRAGENHGRPTLPPSETEAFRMLWARLRYGTADRSLRTLLVVSPMPNEGKTTVAGHLAGAAASVGVRALLVEAMFGPTLAKRIGIEPGQGLSDLLAERASPVEAIQSTESTATNGHRNPGIFGIDLLLAWSVHPNPGELLESQAMRGFSNRRQPTTT